MEHIFGQVFLEAFQNRLVYPFTSETFFMALKYFQHEKFALVCLLAWLGASLGSVVNYGLGVALSSLQASGLSSISQDKYILWGRRVLYVLPVIALFSWVHLTGILLVALGFFRTKPLWVVPAILCGQGVYYLYFLFASQAVM